MNHDTRRPLQNHTERQVDFPTSSSMTPKTSSSMDRWPVGAVGMGLLAGIVGVASMSLPAITDRLSQRDEKPTAVPAQKLEKLLRRPEKLGSSGWLLNHGMHWGQSAFARLLKPSFTKSNLQFAVPSFLFTGLRLSMDQILENLFSTGPTRKLSKHEQRIRIFQKAVYAFATGFFADLVIQSQKRGPLKT